jgi:hypothetical protein
VNSATFRAARAAKQPVSDVSARDLHARLQAIADDDRLHQRWERITKEIRA